MEMLRSHLVLAGFMAAVLTGCAHSKIPNTTIDDTKDNRAILEIVDAYHSAMENRDADAILALVSDDFYEDNGNTDRNDDYGKAQLAETLRSEFEKTEQLQLGLKVEDIVVSEDRAQAFVQYNLRARTDFPSGKKWKTSSDRSRMTLVRVGDKWLIISGL